MIRVTPLYDRFEMIKKETDLIDNWSSGVTLVVFKIIKCLRRKKQK
jgi:hypothetical protein